MAISIAKVSGVDGDTLRNALLDRTLRCEVRDVTLSSAYPTGGEAISAADLSLTSIYFAIATIKVAGTGSATAVHYSTTTNKLLAYTAAAEVANNTNLSAITVRIIAFGA